MPIFLANVAFAKRFAESWDTQAAFAVNLLGAIISGCLEYAALFTGYNNLLIVVGVIYGLAFALKPGTSAVHVASCTDRARWSRSCDDTI